MSVKKDLAEMLEAIGIKKKQQPQVQQKSKTRYTVNLNPLRPFTLVNKKEKIKQQGGTYSQHRFVCNRCGLIFW